MNQAALAQATSLLQSVSLGMDTNVPASGAVGLYYGLLHSSTPDGTHLIAAVPAYPSTPYKVIIRCKSGSISINTGGTATGLAGVGNGISAAGFAPNAFSPIQFLAGDWDQYGSIN